MQFSLRTTFFFSAINPTGLSPADASRILLFELLMHENDQEAARRITTDLAYFADSGPRWCAFMARGLADRTSPLGLRGEMPGMDSRLRTNIATLLGAGFVALHGRVPTKDEAVTEVAEFASTTAEHADVVDRDDAVEALHHLLAYPIGSTSLGQWIARERRDRMEIGDKDTRPSAQFLASLDIAMNIKNKEPGFFLLRARPESIRSSGTRSGLTAHGCMRSASTRRIYAEQSCLLQQHEEKSQGDWHQIRHPARSNRSAE